MRYPMRLLLRSLRGSVPSKLRSFEQGITRDAPLPVTLDLSHVEVLEWAPAFLTSVERLILFSLVCALRPSCYLEIGTLEGGSTLIVAAALEASKNPARLFCVDPRPKISSTHWEVLRERVTLIEGYSPAALLDARRRAGRPFDLAFIDGDHTKLGVYRDAIGALPLLQDGAHVLFHDSLNPDVAAGIDKFTSEFYDVVLDLGSITREATVDEADPNLCWGGLRLVRIVR